MRRGSLNTSRRLRRYVGNRETGATSPYTASIDNFIDSADNKNIEFCGKLAIVRSILNAERSSHLYYDENNSLKRMDGIRIQNTWLSKLFKILTENCKFNDLNKRLSLIKFIIFNYDRCVEHYLFNTIKTYYGVNDKEASEAVENIEIYHPYGVVGKLPWQTSDSSVGYGAEPHPSGLLELSYQIKTFTEGTDEKDSNITKIREKLTNADMVLFLGFAFHPQNMKLIKPISINKLRQGTPAYYATAKGISNHDVGLIRGSIVNLLGIGSNILEIRNDLTCADIFDEYRRTLSLS